MKMDIKQIATEFFNLPDEIFKIEGNIIRLELAINRLTQNIKDMKYFRLEEITRQKDDKGKAMFSNEISRITELNKQLGKDQIYLKLKLDIEALEIELHENKRTFNLMNNKRVVFDRIIQLMLTNPFLFVSAQNSVLTSELDTTDIITSLSTLENEDLLELHNATNDELHSRS